MPPLTPATAGRRKVDYAQDHNAFLNAALAHMRRKEQPTKQIATESGSSLQINVFNGLGVDLDAASIVGIGDVVSPNDEEMVRFEDMFRAVTPAENHYQRFAILPFGCIADDTDIGIVSGEAFVNVDIVDEKHLWANIIPADTAKLRSAPSGAARIVWRESAGTGIKKTRVEFKSVQYRQRFGKAINDIPPNATNGSMHVYELNGAGSAMIDTGEDQSGLHFLFGHDGTKISAGKEVLAIEFRGNDGTPYWHVFPLECEEQPPAAEPLAATAAKTSQYQAVPGDLVIADASSGDFSVLMPASPETDQRVGVQNRSMIGEGGSNTGVVTVDGGTKDVRPARGLLMPNSKKVPMYRRYETTIWRYDGTQWMPEQSVHHGQLIEEWEIDNTSSPVTISTTATPMDFTFVPHFTGQTAQVLQEDNSPSNQKFAFMTDAIMTVELSVVVEHDIDTNNDDTTYLFDNIFTDNASLGGASRLDQIAEAFSSPRAAGSPFLQTKFTKGDVKGYENDTLQFKMSATAQGSSAVKLVKANLIFRIW